MTTQVSTSVIADGSITTAKFDAGAVCPSATNATNATNVTGTGVVTSANIQDSTILPGDLAQPLTKGTSVNSTSGTSIDFTGIPSWAKRITVMLNGVSTNGSSSVLVQIGSGSPTTSGYIGTSNILGTAGAVTALSSGFRVFFNTSDTLASVRHGHIIITNISGNAWSASGVIALSDSSWTCIMAGSVSLAGVLDRVRITTVNGTDTFDAGSINILYE